MYANNCIFIGRLVSDPSLVQGEAEDRVNFTLALNPPGKNSPMYLSCVAWNDTAHHIVSVCGKGCEVSVQGELDISTYTEKKQPQVKRKSFSLKVNNFSVGTRSTKVKAAVKLPNPPIKYNTEKS